MRLFICRLSWPDGIECVSEGGHDCSAHSGKNSFEGDGRSGIQH